MSLAAQAGRGIAWSSAGKAVSQLVGVVVSLVLARLLAPADFGLVAMAVIVTGFLGVVGDLGLTSALIQRETLDERHRSTVFWTLLAFGLALAGGTALVAPWIADFYEAPNLTTLLRVLSIDFVLAPVTTLHYALLARELRFKQIALCEALAVLLSGGLALGLALSGVGLWALVFKSLAASLVLSVGFARMTGWWPTALFDRRALSELWPFSANLLGTTVASYWAHQTDDLLIGKTLGAAPLGLYTRAYGTMMHPVSEVGSVIGRVMFPTLSLLQHDDTEAKRLYLKVLGTTALLIFPVMAGLCAMADTFLLVVFGEQWSGAATVLRIYSVIGAYHAISSTVSWLYKSRGATRLLFRYTLVSSAITILAIAIGARFASIEAVALAYGIATVVLLSYPHFRLAGGLIGLTPGEVLGRVWGVALAAAVMGGLVYGARRALPGLLPPVAELMGYAFLGSIAYLVLLRVGRVQVYAELRLELRRRVEAWAGVEQAETARSATDDTLHD